MTTIYLARHATPDWSRHDIPYHLPPGPPLVESGKNEAHALGEFLRAAGVQQVLASPLDRCEHTAEIVSEQVGVPVQIVPELQEWQPEEKSGDIAARFWPVFESAVQFSEKEGPVAIITHGGPIGVLLNHLGMSEGNLRQQRRFDRSNPVPPAGAWKITRDQAGDTWEMQLVFIPNGKYA